MGYCNCPFIGHPEKIENRKGRSGRWTQQKKKKIENQEKRNRRPEAKKEARWALNTRERGLLYNDSRVDHSVCKGLQLVLTHRGTLINLKPEKMCMVVEHKKRNKIRLKKMSVRGFDSAHS